MQEIFCTICLKFVQKFRLYIGKRKSERVELEGKKTAFFLRLKNVDLAYLLPQGELKEEEFLKYQENLLPTIDRAEKIKDIEKGLYTVSGLVSRVPVESFCLYLNIASSSLEK